MPTKTDTQPIALGVANPEVRALWKEVIQDLFTSGNAEMRELFKEVIREMLTAGHHTPTAPPAYQPAVPSRSKVDPMPSNLYQDIEKRVAIRLYLNEVGRPVTFVELRDAMRAYGMDLPKKDNQAFRVLAITVKQNSGPSEGHDWPAIFYREGHGDVDDVVGLLAWKQQESQTA